MKTSGEERGVTTVRARREKKALYDTKNEDSEAQGKELREISSSNISFP